jgi:hypothetical protein
MSELDGRMVCFRYREDMHGRVQGDSYMPGTVRVHWLEPREHTGVHFITDLVLRPDLEGDNDEQDLLPQPH